MTISDYFKLSDRHEAEVFCPESNVWTKFERTSYAASEFPVASKAEYPINVITVYDTLTSKFYTWGLKKFDKSRMDEVLQQQGIDPIPDSALVYTHCLGEIDLVGKFLSWWANNYPDIATGWNSGGFDVPYIINRIAKLLGDEYSKSLSPVGQLYRRDNAVNIFGQPCEAWQIRGISLLDYMELYRTFSRGESESYKLGNVGAKELGISKIAHDAADLVALADNDWDLFVAYNIQDVNLLVQMDKKLKFLDLARFVTTKGFARAENALGKISIVTGAMAAQAATGGMVMPTFRNDVTTRGEYAGGYVRDPKRGLHSDVVSYDANSLYPNTIITLNISPETKVGKIVARPEPDSPFYLIAATDGTRRKLTPQQFDKLLDKGRCSVSAADVIYSQLRRGIVPDFIDGLYKERVEAKNKIQQLTEQLQQHPEDATNIQTKIDQLDIIQYTIKIVLNSIYGNFANVNSPLFDIDGASSITLSGQATVKQAGEIANKFANEVMPNPNKESRDIVVYGDTDSVYLSFEQLQIPLIDPQRQLTAKGKDVIAQFDHYLNQEITSWAERFFHTQDCRLWFKREVISDATIFLERKRYVLRAAIDEYDRPVDKMKYTGVEIARSTFSDPIKGLIKRVVTKLFETRNMHQTLAAYDEAYNEFTKMGTDDVAKRTSLGKLDEYQAQVHGFERPKGSRIPNHVMGAVMHNKLLDVFGCAMKYQPLQQGSKVKVVYVKPNQYNVSTISFGDKFPEEFGLEVAYDKMFEKMVRPMINKLFDAIGWKLTNNMTVSRSSLSDLFG